MNSEEMDFTNARMLRGKAEEQLNENPQRKSVFDEETDIIKLLQELQVHQIELEMQNEELRKVYEITESALRRYSMVFELSMIGYYTLDPDGTICDLNFTGAEMLDERRLSLIDSNFKLFVSDGSKAVFNKFFKKVYSSNTKESCEVLLGYDNISLCSVYMEGVITEDDKKCLLSVIDISKFVLQNNLPKG